MSYELIHHEGRDEINNNLSWSHHPGCDPALPGCWCSGRGKVSIGICAAVVSCYYSVVTGGRGVIVQPLLCQEWLHGERAPGSMGTLGTMTPAAAVILLLLTLSSTSAQNTSREDLLDISTLLKNFQVVNWKTLCVQPLHLLMDQVGYDRRVRPNYGGIPVYVKVTEIVRMHEEWGVSWILPAGVAVCSLRGRHQRQVHGLHIRHVLQVNYIQTVK